MPGAVITRFAPLHVAVRVLSAEAVAEQDPPRPSWYQMYTYAKAEVQEAKDALNAQVLESKPQVQKAPDRLEAQILEVKAQVKIHEDARIQQAKQAEEAKITSDALLRSTENRVVTLNLTVRQLSDGQVGFNFRILLD